MLPIVRLRHTDTQSGVDTAQRYSTLPVRTKEGIICEAVTIPPKGQLPYEFEVREYEGIQFMFKSESPLDALFARTCEYEAWVSAGCSPPGPSMIYTQAPDNPGAHNRVCGTGSWELRRRSTE
jgi:hypothetical protein